MRLYHAVILLLILLVVCVKVNAEPVVSTIWPLTTATNTAQQHVTIYVPAEDTQEVDITFSTTALLGATLAPTGNSAVIFMPSQAAITWTDAAGVSHTKASNTYTVARILPTPVLVNGEVKQALGKFRPGKEQARIILNWKWGQ